MDEEPTASDGLRGLRAGSRFGNYRLKRLLGKGGFGHVWEAEDTVMDRVVALKLLRSDYSENEKFRQRLFREARAAGRLHEPHVVPIHQCGEIEGQLYIDMRLIDGTNLEAVLSQEGPLAPTRAVAVVRQIAAALDAAHSAGLIHRDVKPANILLTDDDFACLVDFGLANAASDAKLTSTGTTIGTFAYMAPERLSAGGEVDRRVDVYALACVLYEFLTGSPPYSGDIPALISAHLTAPIPRPSQHRPGIPAAFDNVIARGMAKQPTERFASAGELARAASAAAGLSQSPNDPGPRQPGGTRRFPTRSPNPDGTGDTPYSEDVRVPVPAERKPRRGPLVLAAAAVATFLAAALIAALLILHENQGSPSGSDTTVASNRSTSDMTTASPTTRLSSTGLQAQPNLPGTDAQGFVGYAGARCNYTNPAVVIGRTADSALVICKTGVGRFYYRGFGLRNGLSLEIEDPVQTAAGFVATNNGVQYSISPSALLITQGANVLSNEPMLEYWSA